MDNMVAHQIKEGAKGTNALYDEIESTSLDAGAGSEAAYARAGAILRALIDILKAGGTGDLAAILLETEIVEHHLHNIAYSAPFTADGANMTTGTQLTAGSPGFGSWVQIESAANISTRFAGQAYIDPNRVIVRNASAAKVWEISLGFGPDDQHVTEIMRFGIETDASNTGRRSADSEMSLRTMPVDGTQNLYGRVRGSTNGDNVTVIPYLHGYVD